MLMRGDWADFPASTASSDSLKQSERLDHKLPGAQGVADVRR